MLKASVNEEVTNIENLIFMIWVERVSLTILMSQYDQKPITFWYDIIMYIISMQSEIYLLNLYLSC